MPPLRTSRSIETIRSFVAHGLGFTIAGVRPPSDTSFDGLPMAFKPIGHGIEQQEIMLCTMPGFPVSRRLQAVIDYGRVIVWQLPLYSGSGHSVVATAGYILGTWLCVQG